jgi:hypothetical protein
MPYNTFINQRKPPVTLPSYSAISFHSKEEHQAALYDCCLFIVNTYNQTDMLDGHCIENYNGNVTAYDFMKYARNVLNQLAEIN